MSKQMQLYEVNVYFKNSNSEVFFVKDCFIQDEFLTMDGGNYIKVKIPIESILYYTIGEFEKGLMEFTIKTNDYKTMTYKGIIHYELEFGMLYLYTGVREPMSINLGEVVDWYFDRDYEGEE